MPKRLLSSVTVFYPNHNRAELLELVQERLPALRRVLSLKRVVLLGSSAVGRETAFSDVDLLVICDDPPREDAYKLVRHCLELRGLEPHVYSEQQAEKLKATIERMAKDGITLFPKPVKLNLPNLQNTDR